MEVENGAERKESLKENTKGIEYCSSHIKKNIFNLI